MTSMASMDKKPTKIDDVKQLDKIITHKIVCMVINGAMGDQYGAPLEMMCSDLIREKCGDFVSDYTITEKKSDYTYTDDTQMTIGVMNFLIDSENNDDSISNENMFKYHVKYFEPSRGYSMAVYNMFSDFLEKQDMKVIDPKKSLTKTSNGGLMRVSPIIAPCLYSSDQATLKMIEIVHYPTHLNPIALHTSFIYVKLLKFLYNCDETNDCDVIFKNIIEYIKETLIPNCKEHKNEKLRDKLQYIIDNIDKDEYYTLDEVIGLDGVECYETLACAILCLIKNLKHPDKVVAKSITYGGDCDTIAAVTGQLSGVLFGCKAINNKWFQTLENRDMLTQLSEKLVKKFLK